MTYIHWKGRTFNQIYSFIRKNNIENTNIINLYSANPLKHYRREIASIETDICNERTSTKIDVLNNPNGNTQSNSLIQNGLKTILDYNVHNNECTTNSCIFSPAENAKRRVRSSGMLKRKFENNNTSNYYTSTNEYLVNRNISFQQNQYNYFKKGDSLAKPGTSLASANVYSAQSTVVCKKYHIGSDVSFDYKWIDGDTLYTVNIPRGDYDINDINSLLRQKMFDNLHYLIIGTDVNRNDYQYLIHFGYNGLTEKLELQIYNASTTIFSADKYSIPKQRVDHTLDAWIMPDESTYPTIDLNSDVAELFGFNVGTYPVNPTFLNNISLTVSTYTPLIRPLYRPLYYKPNNSQFAQQGAVSSSDLITRKKYNSITNSTVNYRSAFGSSVANALAYGVPSNGYTYKDKIGYPIKLTPTFSRYSPEMKTCSVTRISNLI